MTSLCPDLDSRACWRTGLTERMPLDPGDLRQPRFAITREMRIANVDFGAICLRAALARLGLGFGEPGRALAAADGAAAQST